MPGACREPDEAHKPGLAPRAAELTKLFRGQRLLPIEESADLGLENPPAAF
jgi:hypothetical protein